jgi:hypothetical protein
LRVLVQIPHQTLQRLQRRTDEIRRLPVKGGRMFSHVFQQYLPVAREPGSFLQADPGSRGMKRAQFTGHLLEVIVTDIPFLAQALRELKKFFFKLL